MRIKEEIIKEAWGDLYEKVKNEIDSNGWLDYYSEHNTDDDDFEYLEHGEYNRYHMPYSHVRPKTLSGLENNNGWIRIESEEDLPKESGLYFILDDEYNIIHSEFNVDFGQFFTKDFAYDHYELTHYQPIIKPKPPLY